MTVEVFDNLIQFAVTVGCTIWAGILAAKHKSQIFFILTCFYGVFAMGLLYWLLYLSIKSYTPKVFYVSDLAWVAAFIFLLLLVISINSDDEKSIGPAVPLLVCGAEMVPCIYFLLRGDIATTLMWCGILMAVDFYAVRGILYKPNSKGKKLFYAAVLFISFSEYALWTSSCFWVSDTLTNPYFWFDFMLTAGLLLLLPAAKKAVEL